MAENISKNRKSEAQEIFVQDENAGRFAGNDADAKAAREQAAENIREDNQSSKQERNHNESTDAEAGRDPALTHDYKGEAQDVNDDTERPLNEQELKRARNKADEDVQKGRSDTK